MKTVLNSLFTLYACFMRHKASAISINFFFLQICFIKHCDCNTDYFDFGNQHKMLDLSDATCVQNTTLGQNENHVISAVEIAIGLVIVIGE